MALAAHNTDRGIETCGVLAVNSTDADRTGRFHISQLIIPPQTGTQNTCQTTDEDQLFLYLASNDLITVGWIHVRISSTPCCVVACCLTRAITDTPNAAMLLKLRGFAHALLVPGAPARSHRHRRGAAVQTEVSRLAAGAVCSVIRGAVCVQLECADDVM